MSEQTATPLTVPTFPSQTLSGLSKYALIYILKYHALLFIQKKLGSKIITNTQKYIIVLQTMP